MLRSQLSQMQQEIAIMRKKEILSAVTCPTGGVSAEGGVSPHSSGKNRGVNSGNGVEKDKDRDRGRDREKETEKDKMIFENIFGIQQMLQVRLDMDLPLNLIETF